MDNKLIDYVADSMMEHIPSRMDGAFHPDDPAGYKWARSIAMNCAEAAINAVISYKHPLGIHTDSFISNGSGQCHLCLKKLKEDEVKPGGVHYCPGKPSQHSVGKYDANFPEVNAIVPDVRKYWCEVGLPPEIPNVYSTQNLDNGIPKSQLAYPDGFPPSSLGNPPQNREIVSNTVTVPAGQYKADEVIKMNLTIEKPTKTSDNK